MRNDDHQKFRCLFRWLNLIDTDDIPSKTFELVVFDSYKYGRTHTIANFLGGRL